MKLTNYELEIILRSLGFGKVDLEHVNNAMLLSSNLDGIVLERTLSGMKWQIKLL